MSKSGQVQDSMLSTSSQVRLWWFYVKRRTRALTLTYFNQDEQKEASRAQTASSLPSTRSEARARADAAGGGAPARGGASAVPTPPTPPEVAWPGLRRAEAVHGRMQCSRQGGDAAAVARRRELAFVTSSARGLPSRPGRNSGAQSRGGHRVALRVPGLRPAGSWSRGHATCREDPEPRREDGCRQACR